MLKKVGIKIPLNKTRQHFISEKNLKLDSVFRINFGTSKYGLYVLICAGFLHKD